MESRLVLPHEDLHRDKPKLSLRERFRFYRHYIKSLLRSKKLPIRGKLDLAQEIYNGAYNGNMHIKYDFGETIRALNFKSPRQTLFDQTQPLDAQWQRITQFFDTHGKVLCKPSYGEQGKGIVVLESRLALQDFLSSASEEYLIQEFLRPVKDVRYIYHNDADVTYRICYEKRRTVVKGDGKSTIKDLIKSHPELPRHLKPKMLKAQKHRSSEVLANGVEECLAATGNISNGAYSVLIKDKELNAIDRVMLTLIDKLKTEKGISLSTYCFDIGTLVAFDENAPYRIEDVVFYEFQIPFGFTGYTDSAELDGVRSKTIFMLSNSLQRNWLSRNPVSAETKGSEQAARRCV